MERKMKYILFLISFGVAVIITGCADLEQDISQPSALDRVHHPNISNPADTINFHGDIIRRSGWDMERCQQCHAANFSGGTAQQSCLKCHTGARGPLQCNTCHGDFGDPSRIAPPRAIRDQITTTYKGVGAHVPHLYTSKIGEVRCRNCHQLPSTLYAPTHMDGGPAEVVFDSTVKINIASNAAYNPVTAGCSNTYCHGNFEFTKANAPAERKYAYIADKMTGSNRTVLWTKLDGTEAACGTCHGLPPAGHLNVAINQCVSCHPTVVDESGKIIDKTKHINGKIEYGFY